MQLFPIVDGAIDRFDQSLITLLPFDAAWTAPSQFVEVFVVAGQTRSVNMQAGQTRSVNMQAGQVS